MSTVRFVDAAGNPVANGTLRIHLNADAKGSSRQVSAKVFNIPLDSNGEGITTSIVLLSTLSNSYGDNETPSYVVEVFSAKGELVFGPTQPNDPILPSPLQ